MCAPVPGLAAASQAPAPRPPHHLARSLLFLPLVLYPHAPPAGLGTQQVLNKDLCNEQTGFIYFIINFVWLQSGCMNGSGLGSLLGPAAAPDSSPHVSLSRRTSPVLFTQHPHSPGRPMTRRHSVAHPESFRGKCTVPYPKEAPPVPSDPRSPPAVSCLLSAGFLLVVFNTEMEDLVYDSSPFIFFVCSFCFSF